MNSFLMVLVDIFRQPAVIIGLIALIGLTLQRKSFSDSMKGTVKSFIGFLVLASGAGIVDTALKPFGAMFQDVFHVQGVVPNNEAIVAPALVEYGTVAALIFFFGMIVNILLARFTNFKYIYLSGHVALYQSVMLAIIFMVSGMSAWQAVLFGALAEGVITTVSPALVQPFMHKVTGSDDVALGHTGGMGIAFAGLLAKITGGNPEHSTEKMNVPKNLGFIRDTNVVIFLSMSLVYLVVALIAGPTYVESQVSDGQNYILWAIMQAGMFAAGVFVILAGVRAVLNEIVPAFQGISTKLVPNSKPALDVPITFPFAPNAVMVGFFSSLVAGIICMVIFGFAGLTIIIPGVIAHFMTGAASGVIGNAQGGRRGAIIGAFGNGVIISVVPLVLVPFLGDLGSSSATFSDSDFGVFGLYYGLMSNFGQYGIMGAVVIALVVLFVASALIGRSNAAREAQGV
ncbi:PTS ascorbate transporter subunit IIC [Corynebacterium pyruviciproducens]|uniref:Ascorbate-specific PTS system EIIC component n=1 Tax=Corynebacterium pyruviciproducens TaxID=598660 RepID=A0AAF1BWN9_9CORY|nr:PTS ascorbate transporter subunit IIC [Corynebacterium pyruviciproducens]MDK6566898.1 PTS ascorbate transporter subunit IIC [Corynebacterium pyruviciproducens]WOT02046.1 PTS ascorbate transporter subunit IIC [Corynebacterium pyruviciproducens]